MRSLRPFCNTSKAKLAFSEYNKTHLSVITFIIFSVIIFIRRETRVCFPWVLYVHVLGRVYIAHASG